MPGLSKDPAAAQRQLDALARGREKAARGVLGLEEPGARAKPRQSTGTTPKPARAQSTGTPAVKTLAYDDPEEKPRAQSKRKPRKPARAKREPAPPPAQPERRSGLGAFLDGLKGGL